MRISEDVTIDGPGATSLTISGGHAVRVMSVEAGATLNLEGVTVADGAAPLFGGVFAAAGILNLGTLNVTNSTFSGGSAQDYAGAIGNFSATLTITYTSGSSGLQNLGDGYYQFNWKTPKNYAKACKTLKLNLGEGLVHELLFKFTQ